MSLRSPWIARDRQRRAEDTRHDRPPARAIGRVQPRVPGVLGGRLHEGPVDIGSLSWVLATFQLEQPPQQLGACFGSVVSVVVFVVADHAVNHVDRPRT